MKNIEQWIQRLANAFGFEIRRVKRTALEAFFAPYEPVRPHATYSPWNLDAGFRDTYGRVRNHTLVDRYRCYELWKLVQQSAKLGTGDLIEVGVWRGGTGALICQQARLCGIEGRVFLCDTFRGVVKAGPMDADYRGGEHSDTSRATVEALLGELKLDNAQILEGIFPDESASGISSNRFRFCHIDVDVYESARGIVDWVWDRLVSGGIVVYDDYGFHNCSGITRFVEEQAALPDRIVLHNLNGHAIVIKR